ncbi:MAG: hypothetical protein LBP35_01740 [Candidatus Ancillula trichonymphae]|nr:hypothetical protein [Candidatus Ancillula trichonymphae]
MASCVLLFYSLPTVLCAKLLQGKDCTFVSVVTLSVWLVKIVALIFLFSLLHGLAFFDHQVFATTVFLDALVVTVFEVRYFRKT